MEWDITQYPQIQLIVASKEPFDRLWKTALSFHNSYDQWMNGRWRILLYQILQLYGQTQSFGFHYMFQYTRQIS